MKKEEIWGVSMDRARVFFRKQPDVIEIDPDTFAFHGVRITLEELSPTNAGYFSSRRLQLTMEGPEEEVKTIHHRYFLQFLSTGG